ncbi:MAG: N-acetylglucosamine-6-phosphate deacetylase [Defluviitaleaceae bacterium]|nr:N-acetylglucosamine-6-phosphate deacetylase [Defluviitaleaceae bacterium]
MFIKSSRIYTEDGCKSGCLEIENGVIKQFHLQDSPVKADIDVDYGDKRIIPGIFDTHNHGGHGVRMNDDITEDGIKRYLKGLASVGVTAVFPTVLPADEDFSCMKLLAKMSKETHDGARIMGIHSEGPWGSRVGEKGINTGYPEVDMEYGKKMLAACDGSLKLIGIAPEVNGAYEAVKFFTSKGVNVAAYHTNANYAEANAGIDWGITVATHLGNVMTGLHHRDIGTMGACINRDEVYCEIICDGLHISLPMVDIILRLKDNDKIIMISDAGAYLGAPCGTYKGTVFGNNEESDRATIHVTEEGFVLSKTGRLSGSSKPSIFGIKNLAEVLKLPMEQIVKFASLNPCEKYGIADKKGSIVKGKDADFAVISDDYDVLYTYSEGRLVYDYEKDTDLFNHKFVEEYKL